ncbi:hypothetical protein G6F56_008783 [Rhizopus delemar]|nr:hypothetical protein G6F56_008783 [Rhizopus delemar]
MDPRSFSTEHTIDLPNKAFSMDLLNNTLAIAMADKRIHIYDIRNLSQPSQTRDTTLKYMLKCIRLMPQAEGFACSSIEGRVALEFFDPASQDKKYAFKLHRQTINDTEVVYPVNALAFHPKYGTFASGGSDCIVNIWDGVHRKRVKQFTGYPDEIASIAFSRDGSTMAVASSYTFDEGERGHAPDAVFVRELQDSEVRPLKETNPKEEPKEESEEKPKEGPKEEPKEESKEERKRKRLIISDSEESENEEVKKVKTETEKMNLDSDIKTKDTPKADENVDLEIEQANAEEKQEKQEQKETKAAIKLIANTTKKTDINVEKGSPIPYAILCNVFQKCENTTKRLEITEHLVTLFSSVIETNSNGLLDILYMSINKLCPDYVGLELGIGESLLLKAIAESTGRSVKQIKADYIKVGDLGTIAQESKGSQRTLFKPKPLTVPHVFQVLKEVAMISGNSAQSKKIGKIKGLLVACQESEAKYIIRQLEEI